MNWNAPVLSFRGGFNRRGKGGCTGEKGEATQSIKIRKEEGRETRGKDSCDVMWGGE